MLYSTFPSFWKKKTDGESKAKLRYVHSSGRVCDGRHLRCGLVHEKRLLILLPSAHRVVLFVYTDGALLLGLGWNKFGIYKLRANISLKKREGACERARRREVKGRVAFSERLSMVARLRGPHGRCTGRRHGPKRWEIHTAAAAEEESTETWCTVLDDVTAPLPAGLTRQ